LKQNCVKESTSPNPAEAATVHVKPIAYFALETPEVPSEDSLLKTSRIEEMVRRTRELIINGVNFCALRKKEKTELKAN
jgi:hypothetical protein